MIKPLIPHALTLSNLLFGLIGIVYASKGFDNNEAQIILLLVGLSLLADAFDGAAARMLSVSGELGKQLDSLADVVSFGVLPGMAIYMQWQNPEAGIFQPALLAFLIPLGAAVRLGRFNVDTRQGSYFIGLPSPSQAIASIGFLFFYEDIQALHTYGAYIPWLILGVFSALMCWAMNTERFTLPSPKSLKEQGGKKTLIISVVIAVPLIFILREKSLPIIILLYLIISGLIFRPNTKEKHNL
jgi:CDP-diacylglycerol--serine O-phosphatidyltransferase